MSRACRGRAKTAEAAPLRRARGRACCIAAAAAPLGSSLPTMAAPSPSGGGGSGGGSGSGTPGPVGSPASGHPAVSSMQGKERGSAETWAPWRGRRRRRGLSPRPRTPPDRLRKPPEPPLLPQSLLRGFPPRAGRLGLGLNPGSGLRRPRSRPLPALGPWALPGCSADSRGPPGSGPPPRSPPSRPLLTWRAPRPHFRERAGQGCGGAGGAAGPGCLTPGRSGRRRRRPPRPGTPQP